MWAVLLWTGALVLLDQASKAYVRANFNIGEFRPIIPGVLDIRHVENTGIAFGMFQGAGLWLAPVALLVAIVAVVGYIRSDSSERLFRLSMILVTAGAAGNFIDRVFHGGRVTDFIDLRFIHVFNVADMCITFAVALLAIRWIAEELRPKRDKAVPADSESGTGPGN
ncbi:MAG: signal peptidase II [Armatimonadetes bacterium]|nr:signal peptidase II [Armatimonadota bacterium]